jgi:hypothetical protein
MARTPKEKVVDRLLDLYIVDRCKTQHGIDNISETKLHKLLFFSEKKLIECKLKSINYSFVKLLFPTFSQELRRDLTELSELGFLKGPYFNESEQAQMIIQDFQPVFQNNKEIMDLINSEVDKYAPIPTDRLVAQTKRMKWKTSTIDELKNGTPLLYPLKPERSRDFFKISDEDYEDLAICLSPKVTRVMLSALEDLKKGRKLQHEEIFG